MEGNRLLVDAIPEKTFYLSNGKHIRNLVELVSELETISHDEFVHHCNPDKDDFATWIDDALGIGELAVKLRNIKDKHDYIKAIKAELHPPKNQVEDTTATVVDNIVNIAHSKIIEELPIKHSVESHSHLAKHQAHKEIPKKIVKKVVVRKNADAPVSIPSNFSKDLDKLKAVIDTVSKANIELNSKISGLEKTNFELSKKLDIVTKTNSDYSKKIDVLNFELSKKIDIVTKTNSDYGKKIDVLNRNITESVSSNIIADDVSKYFANEEFKNKIVDVFKPIITNLHSKDRNALKSEVSKVMDLNALLDKRLEVSLANRAKQIQSVAQSSVTEALNANLDNVNKKIDKVLESKMTKLENAFDKKVELAASAHLAKFKSDVMQERHDLRAVASDVMHKEFEKVFNSDEYLSKIVSKYQKMFTESAESIARTHKAFEDKFDAELTTIKDKIIIESRNVLNKQLTDTIQKQRGVLDAELAKTLNSNKFFVSRFEKEIMAREKIFLETADRQLKENYTVHNGKLSADFDKYHHELSDLKLQSEKDFKLQEAQLDELIKSKIHKELNKEFDDILLNQRTQLTESVNVIRANALNKLDLEFNELLSKHKQFMMNQFNKAAADQVALKDKFVVDLKSEEDKMLSKVKELMQSDLTLTLNSQRDLLDKELTKTVLANKYFVERFEKEIVDMNETLKDSATKMFNTNYEKQSKMLQESHAKQLESLRTMVASANNDLANAETQMHANLNAIIPATVRESVNREFGRLILDEKAALEVELKKAEAFNQTIEKKMEGELKKRAQIIIENVSADASAKFAELLSLQQYKLDQELLRAKKSYDVIENKKNDIIAKTNSVLENINNYSADKLKELEREHDKHLKKVSQISSLISKAESALSDVKGLKAEVYQDKKTISKESKEYSGLMSELSDLKESLSKEKTWMSLYHKKINLYNLIRQCDEYINKKDAANTKVLYDKIAETYRTTPFEDADKLELHTAIGILLKEIQGVFGK